MLHFIVWNHNFYSLFLNLSTFLCFIGIELSPGCMVNTKAPLRDKSLNTEFFLVRISPHSDWIRRDTRYLSLFSPNSGKYEPEKTLHLGTFHAVQAFCGDQGEWDGIRLFYKQKAWYYGENKIKHYGDTLF